MLLQMSGLIAKSTSKDCPEDFRQIVQILMWVTPYVEVPEVAEVTQQLQFRYGKSFVQNATKNKGGFVKEHIYERLTGHVPVYDAQVGLLSSW
jgi:hypothetical protein